MTQDTFLGLFHMGPGVGLSPSLFYVFFHSPDQEAVARASMESLQGSGKVNGNIVTDISPASDFWRAEDYHQRYLEKQGRG